MNFDSKFRFKRCKWFLAFALALLTIFFLGALASADQDISDKKSSISSASEINYPPFCFVNEDGRANGFSVELLRAALKSMGREVTFRTGPWAEVKQWLERGNVQALPLVGRTPEREALFDFTFPYMSLHGAIVIRSDTTGIQNLGDLKGRQVVVMKGDNAEEFIRREDRGIKIHTTATFEEALEALSQGLYDAVVIQRLVALRLLQETGFKNLRIINQPIDGFRQDFCFAVREGDSKTLSLLNEGLSLVMADGTYRHLHAKWFAALELPSSRRIKVGGDHNYPPFEYLDENGRPAGYNVDLTRAIAREMGLDIDIQLGPWSEIVGGLQNGTFDVIQGMFYSPERDLKFDFTPPHAATQYVSVVRKGNGAPPKNIAELTGKRIVVQKGDIMNDFVLENGLKNQVSVVDSQEDALRDLSKGKYACALVARLTALYWIKKQGWDNLVVGQHAILSPEYCYAVLNNHKALSAQFSEGLKVLEDTGEYRRIYNRWIGVYEESPPSLVTILRYVAMVATPLLLLLLVFSLWSWSLRKQVASRTAALRESEESLLITLHSIGDAVIATDLAGHITRMNRVAEDLTGWAFTSAKGMMLNQVFNIINAKTRKEVENPVKLVIEGGKIVGLANHTVLIRRDGSEFQIADTAAPILDKNGKIRGVILVFSDVTNRYKTERELLELGEAVKQVSEGVVITNTEGQFVYANQAFEKITGYSFNEFLGQTPRILKSGKQDEAFYKNLWDTILSGTPWTGRMINKRKDGTFYTAECFISPIKDSEGKTTNFVWMTRDISKELNLENMLIQAQKMDSIGRLAGGVAHDYNNMLSIIIGYAELAMEKVDPNAPLHADLEEVLTAAKRSTDITRQLLAFARQQTIAPKVLDLNDTIESMLKMLRRLIGEDIDLAWLPGAEVWPVKIDPTQVDQVLANLCVNARDAITDVGKVTIETDNIRFDETYCADHPGFSPGEYVLLAVSDDGTGMAPETLDQIFEPFFTTKALGKGTGLGLATVYGIVKQNNGFINVYSEPDKGTTIKVYLSRYTGQTVAADRNANLEVPSSRGETILLVEDDASILKLGERILESLGYTVLSASSPTEAIRLAKERTGKIDLLITDVVMPEMNGRELSEQMQPIYPNLKTLFMSGYTANVIAHRGVLEDGVCFISKPFSKIDMAVKVREVLDEAKSSAHD